MFVDCIVVTLSFFASICPSSMAVPHKHSRNKEQFIFSFQKATSRKVLMRVSPFFFNKYAIVSFEFSGYV